MIRIAILLTMLFGCGGDGGKAVDASTIDTPQVCTGGTTGYLQACTLGSSTCGSVCACHDFGHAQLCTKMCTGDGECPAPSAGCSGGFCRP